MENNDWSVYSTVSSMNFGQAEDCQGRNFTVQCLKTGDREEKSWALKHCQECSDCCVHVLAKNLTTTEEIYGKKRSFFRMLFRFFWRR